MGQVSKEMQDGIFTSNRKIPLDFSVKIFTISSVNEPSDKTYLFLLTLIIFQKKIK